MVAKRKLVYTVITGDYDTLRPIKREKGFDYVCLTDNPNIRKNGWDLQIIEKTPNPLIQQRGIKIFSYFRNYDLTIYMDANFRVYRPLSELIANYYRGGFLTCKHDSRNLISEEMKRVLEVGKCNKGNIELVKLIMTRNNIPDDCGMYASGFIVRDNSNEVIDLEKKWYDLLINSSYRDQLTLGPAAYLTGTKINTISRWELKRYAILQPHKRQ